MTIADTEADPILRGIPLDPSSATQPVQTYGEHRVCAEPGCETHLSRYNEFPRCAAHQVPKHTLMAARRGRKPKEPTP